MVYGMALVLALMLGAAVYGFGLGTGLPAAAAQAAFFALAALFMVGFGRTVTSEPSRWFRLGRDARAEPSDPAEEGTAAFRDPPSSQRWVRAPTR